MGLELKDARVEFGPKSVVHDVSLVLEPGEAVALIGPNGAGKTTVLRACAGLQKLKSGRVEVDGHALQSLSTRARARLLSFVGQVQPVVFDFTALEFVLMALSAGRSPFALESDSDIESARAALDKMAIRHVENQPMNTLSSGEHQRVLIARTLLMDTKIWLLDEPTSNLDLKHQWAILSFFKEATSRGLGILAVMHDLNAIPDFFDRVILMNEGRVVLDGSPQDVLHPDILAPVYGVGLRTIRDGKSSALVLDPSGNQT